MFEASVREVVSSIPDRGNLVGYVFFIRPRWLVRFSSSKHAFPSKFWNYLTLSSWGSGNYRPSAPLLYEVASHVKQLPFRPLLLFSTFCLSGLPFARHLRHLISSIHPQNVNMPAQPHLRKVTSVSIWCFPLLNVLILLLLSLFSVTGIPFIRLNINCHFCCFLPFLFLVSIFLHEAALVWWWFLHFILPQLSGQLFQDGCICSFINPAYS